MLFFFFFLILYFFLVESLSDEQNEQKREPILARKAISKDELDEIVTAMVLASADLPIANIGPTEPMTESSDHIEDAKPEKVNEEPLTASSRNEENMGRKTLPELLSTRSDLYKLVKLHVAVGKLLVEKSCFSKASDMFKNAKMTIDPTSVEIKALGKVSCIFFS